jgi:hypothetical protein
VARHECPWVDNMVPGVPYLKQHFPEIHLERGANEVLLLHGTSEEIAKRISHEGFDDRLNTRAM